MELSNEFRVDVSVPEAWKVLTDVERIAPMLPGAQLQEVEGDEYRGVVRVKVGPITAQYKGKAAFEERDEAAGRVVLRATGRDSRGQGNANALITATMSPDGDGTKVTVQTDLTVTGKVAQFGRGVLADISSKLIGQFVDSLEADLADPGRWRPGARPLRHTGDARDARDARDVDQRLSDRIRPGRDCDNQWPDRHRTPSHRGPGQRSRLTCSLALAGGSTMKRLAPLAGLAVVLVVVRARGLGGPSQATGKAAKQLPGICRRWVQLTQPILSP